MEGLGPPPARHPQCSVRACLGFADHYFKTINLKLDKLHCCTEKKTGPQEAKDQSKAIQLWALSLLLMWTDSYLGRKIKTTAPSHFPSYSLCREASSRFSRVVEDHRDGRLQAPGEQGLFHLCIPRVLRNCRCLLNVY